MRPGGPKRLPRLLPQEAPRRRPPRRSTQDAPRAPHGPPRDPQDAPRGFQQASRRHPRRLREAFKMRPAIIMLARFILLIIIIRIFPNILIILIIFLILLPLLLTPLIIRLLFLIHLLILIPFIIMSPPLPSSIHPSSQPTPYRHPSFARFGCPPLCSHISLVTSTRLGVVSGWAGGNARSVIRNCSGLTAQPVGTFSSIPACTSCMTGSAAARARQ